MKGCKFTLFLLLIIILVKNCLESLNRNKVSHTTYKSIKGIGVIKKVYKKH